MKLRDDGHQGGHNDATLTGSEIIGTAGGSCVHYLKTDVRGMQQRGDVRGRELQSVTGAEYDQFRFKCHDLLNMCAIQFGRMTGWPVFHDPVGAENQAAGIKDIINDNACSRIGPDDITASGRGIQLYFHAVYGYQPQDLTIKQQ